MSLKFKKKLPGNHENMKLTVANHIFVLKYLVHNKSFSNI